ncbi:MAG: hypothetical protein AAF297_11835, partial [Planctomycetota bacterium]
MSWLAFAVTLWAGLGLELGLRDALRLGTGNIAPSFVVPIAVWFALNAQQKPALWAALIAGALLDLTAAMPRTDGGDALILGPRALGLLLAAKLILSVRAKLYRKNPITLGVGSGAAAAVMAFVVVTLFAARTALGDPFRWSIGAELGTRLLGALYTAGIGFLVAIPLRWVDGVFGFPADRTS